MVDTPNLAEARRIIVKIGSALLVDDATGAIRHDWLDRLADDVANLRADGREVVIVTSGAISVGRRHLGLTRSRIRLEEKQAAAATGQIRLAHAYAETFARHGVTVAQILLTPEDTEERRRHLNARATLDTLLGLGAIPVVNENDTVATAEIRFGDNDRLAARVAQMISADTLILLSDIDGLYTADPKRHPDARHIPVVAALTPEIEAMAGDALPGYSSGGMVTKLAAARIAVAAGCRMIIAQGRCDHPIAAIAAGQRCTWFLAGSGARAARKRWIAGSVKPRGTLVVDPGAARALVQGRSLLPAGVVAVEGRFERGDPVIIRDAAGRDLGHGLAAYGSADATRIRGHQSDRIAAILGYQGREEMVHRDDLALAEETQ